MAKEHINDIDHHLHVTNQSRGLDLDPLSEPPTVVQSTTTVSLPHHIDDSVVHIDLIPFPETCFGSINLPH